MVDANAINDIISSTLPPELIPFLKIKINPIKAVILAKIYLLKIQEVNNFFMILILKNDL